MVTPAKWKIAFHLPGAAPNGGTRWWMKCNISSLGHMNLWNEQHIWWCLHLLSEIWHLIHQGTLPSFQKRSVYDHKFVIAVVNWLWSRQPYCSVSGYGAGLGWGLGRRLAPSPDYLNTFFVPTQQPIFTPGPDNRLCNYYHELLHYHMKIMSYVC